MECWLEIDVGMFWEEGKIEVIRWVGREGWVRRGVGWWGWERNQLSFHPFITSRKYVSANIVQTAKVLLYKEVSFRIFQSMAYKGHIIWKKISHFDQKMLNITLNAIFCC